MLRHLVENRVGISPMPLIIVLGNSDVSKSTHRMTYSLHMILPTQNVGAVQKSGNFHCPSDGSLWLNW